MAKTKTVYVCDCCEAEFDSMTEFEIHNYEVHAQKAECELQQKTEK